MCTLTHVQQSQANMCQTVYVHTHTHVLTAALGLGGQSLGALIVCMPKIVLLVQQTCKQETTTAILANNKLEVFRSIKALCMSTSIAGIIRSN